MSTTKRPEKRTDLFWQRIQREIGDVAIHLQNILNFQELSATKALGTLSSDDIAEVQMQIREAAPRIQKLIRNSGGSVTMSEFYGSFADDPEQFAFSLGEVHVFRTIIETIKENGIHPYITDSGPNATVSVCVSSDRDSACMRNEWGALKARIKYHLSQSSIDGPTARYTEEVKQSLDTVDVQPKVVQGKIVAVVPCAKCTRTIKLVREPPRSWPTYNIIRHFNGHLKIKTNGRHKRNKITMVDEEDNRLDEEDREQDHPPYRASSPLNESNLLSVQQSTDSFSQMSVPPNVRRSATTEIAPLESYKAACSQKNFQPSVQRYIDVDTTESGLSGIVTATYSLNTVQPSVQRPSDVNMTKSGPSGTTTTTNVQKTVQPSIQRPEQHLHDVDTTENGPPGTMTTTNVQKTVQPSIQRPEQHLHDVDTTESGPSGTMRTTNVQKTIQPSVQRPEQHLHDVDTTESGPSGIMTMINVQKTVQPSIQRPEQHLHDVDTTESGPSGIVTATYSEITVQRPFDGDLAESSPPEIAPAECSQEYVVEKLDYSENYMEEIEIEREDNLGNFPNCAQVSSSQDTAFRFVHDSENTLTSSQVVEHESVQDVHQRSTNTSISDGLFQPGCDQDNASAYPPVLYESQFLEFISAHETSIQTENSICDSDHSSDLNCSKFFDKLVEMHNRIKDCNIHSRRYDDLEKDIGTFEYLTAGNAHYQYVSANMSTMSKKTIQRHMQQYTMHISEGVLDIQGLKKHLLDNKYPMAITLCEDGTRIRAAVEYDYSSDSIKGLVSDLDSNGLPKKDKFEASSPYDMVKDLKKFPIGNYAYVQVAIPLTSGAIPYVLYHTCSNNKFAFKDVLNRWTYTEALLRREGITVIAHASDGDSRLMKAMKQRAGFEKPRVPSHWGQWFRVDCRETTPINVQDMVHTLNKLRNRLLNHDLKLELVSLISVEEHYNWNSLTITKNKTHYPPKVWNRFTEYCNTQCEYCSTLKSLASPEIGTYTVSKDHLIDLVKNYSKDKHGLCMSDIELKDKMSFSPTLKMMNPHMIEFFKQNVPNSDGTAVFLELMQRLYRSFIEMNVPLVERVLNIWTVTFVVRAWRNYCLQNKTFTSDCITANAYYCLELNAHAIILFITKCRDDGVPEQCIISSLSSQPCEQLFREMRSMSTTNQTVVNFTIKEFTEKLKRIYMKRFIMYKNQHEINFPFMIKQQNKSNSGYHIPSNEDVIRIINNAQDMARQILDSVGMESTFINMNDSVNKILNAVEIEFVDLGTGETFDDEIPDDDDYSNQHTDPCNDSEDELTGKINFEHATANPGSSEEHPVYEAAKIFPNFNDNLQLKSCRTGNKHTFKIVDIKGEIKHIKKSTLLWMLTEGRHKLSSDRMRRFQQREKLK